MPPGLKYSRKQKAPLSAGPDIDPYRSRSWQFCSSFAEFSLIFLQRAEKLLIPDAACELGYHWGKPHTVRLLPSEEIPQAALRTYYTRHLAGLPDVLTVKQISAAKLSEATGGLSIPGLT